MADLESLLEYNQIVSQMFDSEVEGFQFYNRYALKKGFSVRRSYAEWDAGHNELTLRKFVCSREGFREAKHMKREDKQRRPRNITRVGCRAKFYVKDFINDHNHPLAPKDLSCLLRSHRRINDEQKADILEMEISGIRKHQIFEIQEMQYDGYDKVGYTQRDLYNFCHRHNQGTIFAGDAQTVIGHLRERERRDADFFFRIMTDEQGHLVGLFWCDTQYLLDYAAFGDVVVFDSIYKTNRYNLPLVPFVGVNHHKRTILFGCGIISRENKNSYKWLLRTFFEANIQKHPISVITDGDLAMQRAIRIVWLNSSHRLCGWHIEQNLVRNVHNDKLKEAFRVFMYDCCSIQEIDRKWLAFLAENECAAYHVGKCYLGLRSNQRSESMNARLQMQLDGKMTMLEMVEHYETCLSMVRRNEADDDIKALQYEPFKAPDASILEIDAKKRFTPNGNLKGISCSCRKLESLGTPCSHIFFVLGHRGERKLPDCCVLERWTMGAKSAFPPIRMSTMYEYSATLLRYRDLRNISRAASFSESRSTEAYELLRGALQEAATILPNVGANEGNMYGPVLPQAPEADCEDIRDVLDPMHVPGRGALKKMLKPSTATASKSKTKCSLCKVAGHNQRKCPTGDEVFQCSS
ncbi:hypothetical protein PVAP13_4NG289338 [Panicum virgatum]|uniref:SWIM-type domain-containing protein n=1 Tax=Panicum virgatum TaxID=38727 RepID=A0A8T0TH79_PANVG|nr:hypothetical protein PVAP13_4NG289338 [Panicum virgatum]